MQTAIDLHWYLGKFNHFPSSTWSTKPISPQIWFIYNQTVGKGRQLSVHISQSLAVSSNANYSFSVASPQRNLLTVKYYIRYQSIYQSIASFLISICHSTFSRVMIIRLNFRIRFPPFIIISYRETIYDIFIIIY